jgi:hypothetical protein
MLGRNTLGHCFEVYIFKPLCWSWSWYSCPTSSRCSRCRGCCSACCRYRPQGSCHHLRPGPVSPCHHSQSPCLSQAFCCLAAASAPFWLAKGWRWQQQARAQPRQSQRHIEDRLQLEAKLAASQRRRRSGWGTLNDGMHTDLVQHA